MHFPQFFNDNAKYVLAVSREIVIKCAAQILECRDGAITSWAINQYFWGVKCLAQGHNTGAVGLEPRTSRSGVLG